MAQIPFVLAAAFASALGVFSYLAYRMHGEHHAAVPEFALGFVLEPIVIFVFLFGYAGLPGLEALLLVAATWWAYVASGRMCMFVYRAYFHRLGYAFKITKLDNYKQLDKLHSKYGQYVRTGISNLLKTSHQAFLGIVYDV